MKLHDISTEQALIGSILIEGNKLFEEIIGILDETDFYKTSHSIIFKCISGLFKRNKGIDLVIVTEELNKTNLLEGTCLRIFINKSGSFCHFGLFNETVESR